MFFGNMFRERFSGDKKVPAGMSTRRPGFLKYPGDQQLLRDTKTQDWLAWRAKCYYTPWHGF